MTFSYSTSHVTGNEYLVLVDTPSRAVMQQAWQPMYILWNTITQLQTAGENS